MHIAPIDPTTSAVSHGGERYEPDENGLFDVPLELAERLLQGPGWEAYVAPEPTTDLDELRAIAEKGVEAARLLAEAEAEAAAKDAEEARAQAEADAVARDDGVKKQARTRAPKAE